MEPLSVMDYFRKHQKVMMVALVAVSMFCFIIIDDISQWDPRTAAPLVLAFVFGIAFWLLGLQDKKGPGFTVTGALIGAVIGLIPLVTARDTSGVATSIGQLSAQEMAQLRHDRQIANNFVATAFQKRENPQTWELERYNFGDSSARAMVAGWLMRHEARQSGIRISDKYINTFIQEVAGGRLTRDDLMKFRMDYGVSEVELFDILRAELEVRVAMQLISPEVARMPEQYWRDFQKLNVTTSVDVTAIPVEQFTKKLEAPNDGELKALFEKYRTVFPVNETPGFRQPDRLQLAWFDIDYELVEKTVGPISEEDLKKAYEERRETQFKVNALPDLKGGALDSLKLDIPDLDGGTKPGDVKSLELPKSDPDSKPADEKPASDKPADPSKTEDKPAVPEGKADDKSAPAGKESVEEPKADKPAAEEGSCAEDEPAAKPADAVKPADSEPEKPADGDKPADPAKSDAGKAAPPVPESKSEAPAAAEPAKPATPGYRPFEEVRDELQDILLRDRTRELIKQKVEDGIGALRAWRQEAEAKWPETVAEADAAKAAAGRAEAAKFVAQKAEAWAKENGVRFGQSGMVSRTELQADSTNPLSSAREIPDQNDFMAMINGPKPVIERIFSGIINLNFTAEEAEPAASSDSRLLFWIADRRDEHEPTFDEPGVRELVVKAWQAEKARPLAEKRAQELAKLAAEQVAAKPLAEILAGQTVTGDSDGLQLSVIQSGPVTWLRQAASGLQMNPFQRPSVEMGVIPGVDKAGNEFMKTIAETPLGQVQSIPNADRSVFYVVHVKARNPESLTSPSAEDLKKKFIGGEVATSPVYGTLASSDYTLVNVNWFASLMRKYAVDLAALDSADQ